MSLPITITNAGLAELINANANGTQAIEITAIGVSATAITPEPTMTALAGELYRITNVSGSQVSPDTIHVTMQDISANAYSMLSFGLYLADGTLFAIYGQATAILTKTTASIGLLAVDVTFAQAVAASITFGNTNFLNPPASQTVMGVVQLATLAQAEAGTDNATALTPLGATNAVVNWIAGKAVNLGNILRAGYQVWDAGNDGAGSGLDADLIHGETPAALLAPYATTAAVNAALEPYATTAAVNATLAPYATTAALESDLSAYAPLNSPDLTGTPLTPTAAADDNSTRIANTEWIWSNIQALVAGCIAAVATAAGCSWSFAATGYFRAPTWLGGLMVNWGTLSLASGTGTQSVNFAAAFPNAAWLPLAINSTANVPTSWCGAGNLATTRMSVGFATASNTAAPNGQGAWWLVIGN